MKKRALAILAAGLFLFAGRGGLPTLLGATEPKAKTPAGDLYTGKFFTMRVPPGWKTSPLMPDGSWNSSIVYNGDFTQGEIEVMLVKAAYTDSDARRNVATAVNGAGTEQSVTQPLKIKVGKLYGYQLSGIVIRGDGNRGFLRAEMGGPRAVYKIRCEAPLAAFESWRGWCQNAINHFRPL